MFAYSNFNLLKYLFLKKKKPSAVTGNKEGCLVMCDVQIKTEPHKEISEKVWLSWLGLS